MALCANLDDLPWAGENAAGALGTTQRSGRGLEHRGPERLRRCPDKPWPHHRRLGPERFLGLVRLKGEQDVETKVLRMLRRVYLTLHRKVIVWKCC